MQPLEDIVPLRMLDERLAELSNECLAGLYQRWSQETASASWLTMSFRGNKVFKEWCFKTPFDSFIEEYNEHHEG